MKMVYLLCDVVPYMIGEVAGDVVLFLKMVFQICQSCVALALQPSIKQNQRHLK